ncbi:MAG: hypothetical protein PHS53_01560 [Candidatus Pacebacteria bacterium]|nr:hypothetical protein [Candidatus Paceibacterota bacterium]MDD5356816.1 hypothetical protein [Candidatus Paceibacterota bacterium]
MRDSIKKFLAFTLCFGAIFFVTGCLVKEVYADPVIAIPANFSYVNVPMWDKGKHTLPNGVTYEVYSGCNHTSDDLYGICGGHNVIRDLSTGKYYDVPRLGTAPGREVDTPEGAPSAPIVDTSNDAPAPPPPEDNGPVDCSSGECVVSPTNTNSGFSNTPPNAGLVDNAQQQALEAQIATAQAEQDLTDASSKLNYFHDQYPYIFDADGGIQAADVIQANEDIANYNRYNGTNIPPLSAESYDSIRQQDQDFLNEFTTARQNYEAALDYQATAEQNFNSLDDYAQPDSASGSSGSGITAAGGVAGLLTGSTGTADPIVQPIVQQGNVESGKQKGTAVPVTNDILEKAAVGTHANTTAQVKKDFTLDGIAKMIAERMVHQIATSIVQWINTGFKGAPAFVTDLKGFMEKVGDDVTATFITKSGLLQTPYGPLIAQAIIGARTGNFNLQPVFTSALAQGQGVVNQFLGGDFYAGGLQGFYDVSQNCNNYQCATLAAINRNNVLVQEEEHRKELEYLAGQGFKPKTVCDGSKGSPCDHQSVVTPGSILRENLNQALGSDLITLENVHDINEIIGALMGQLINMVTTSSGGLSGTSAPTRSKVNKNGTISQVSFLADLNSGVDIVTLAQAKGPTLALIDENLTKAKNPNRLTLFTGALAKVNEAENLIGQVKICYEDKLDPSFDPPLSDSDKNLAGGRIDSADTVLSTLIAPVKTALAHEISIVNTKANALQKIRNALTAATTVADANTIINTYKSQYVNTGNTLEEDIQSLTGQVGTIEGDAQTQLDECEALEGVQNNP